MKSERETRRSSARRSPGKARSPEELLSLRDAAAEFGVSIRTLQRFRADGRLPGIRQGRIITVRRQDVERALSWKDPTTLLRKLLSTDDRAPLDAWMDGWKQLTRLTASDPAVAEVWMAWSDAALRTSPGRCVRDYRVVHMLAAANEIGRHEQVDRMIHSMRQFDDQVIVRDALREFFESVAPWTRA